MDWALDSMYLIEPYWFRGAEHEAEAGHLAARRATGKRVDSLVQHFGKNSGTRPALLAHQFERPTLQRAMQYYGEERVRVGEPRLPSSAADGQAIAGGPDTD
jgi:hypothetical protein